MKVNLKYLPVVFILLAAGFRLLPHIPNATPLAAMALLGGAYLGKPYALWVPLAAMALSDTLIGWHSTWPFVYIAFLITGAIGLKLRENVRPGSVLLASLTSSVLFFIITNLGVWMVTPLYPPTPSGLALCYTAALPFFRNTLLGDIFFCAVLFGLQEFSLRHFSTGVPSPIRSSR